MREAVQVAFELNRAMPRLKRERRAPHDPEIRLKERGVELIGDAACPQRLLRFQRHAFKGQDVSLRQAEFWSVDSVAIPEYPGFGRSLHRLVPLEDLLSHRHPLIQS